MPPGASVPCAGESQPDCAAPGATQASNSRERITISLRIRLIESRSLIVRHTWRAYVREIDSELQQNFYRGVSMRFLICFLARAMLLPAAAAVNPPADLEARRKALSDL